MRRAEVARILAVFAASYPRFEVDDIKVQVWHEMVGDIDYQLANAAAKKIIVEKTFPPSIAEFREAAFELTSPRKMSGAEAWGEVKNAIKRYGYYREEEALKSMSETTRKVVQAFGWQDICMSDDPESVLRGQFIKQYEQIDQQNRRDKQLPADLQELIAELADSKSLRVLNGGKSG